MLKLKVLLISIDNNLSEAAPPHHRKNHIAGLVKNIPYCQQSRQLRIVYLPGLLTISRVILIKGNSVNTSQPQEPRPRYILFARVPLSCNSVLTLKY